MSHWHEPLSHAEISINCARPCTHNDNISPYEGIHKSKYDMLARPIGVAGCAVVVHKTRGQHDPREPAGVTVA